MSLDTVATTLLEELRRHVQTGNIAAGKQTLAQMKVRIIDDRIVNETKTY